MNCTAASSQLRREDDLLPFAATAALQAAATALSYCPTPRYLLGEISCSWLHHGNSSRSKHVKNALHHSAPPAAAPGSSSRGCAEKHNAISQHPSALCSAPLTATGQPQVGWQSGPWEHTSPFTAANAFVVRLKSFPWRSREEITGRRA